MADSSLAKVGGITVSIKSSSLVKVLNVIRPCLLKKLMKIGIPNLPTISTPLVTTVGVANTGFITITGGSFIPTAVTFSQIIQLPDNGKFVVEAIFSGNLHFSSWVEERTEISASSTPNTPPLNIDKVKNYLAAFTVTFSSLAIQFDVDVELDALHNLNFKVGNGSVLGESFTFQFPAGTLLKDSEHTCVVTKIKAILGNQMAKMMGSIISEIECCIKNAFDVIRKSGAVMDCFGYYYGGCSEGLKLLSSKGIQYRFKGVARTDGYCSPDELWEVPFPDIPVKYDAIFNVSNYEFRSLFWAYCMKNKFEFTIGVNDIYDVDRVMLTTNYYQPSLYQDYPNRNLIVKVCINKKPSVILADKRGGSVTYTAIFTVWVAETGSTIKKEKQIISLAVSETADMCDFAVSTRLPTFAQSLTFTLVFEQNRPFIAHLENKGLDYADAEMFLDLWKLVSSPILLRSLNKAANTGVPLPSAMMGVFKDYDISIHPSFVTVAVNFGSRSQFKSRIPSHFGDVAADATLPNFSF